MNIEEIANKLPYPCNIGLILEINLHPNIEGYWVARYASWNYKGDPLKSKATITATPNQFSNSKILMADSGKNKGRHYFDDGRGMFTRIYLNPRFEKYF